MTDLLKLILGVLASLFRSEHSWRRRKIWSCGGDGDQSANAATAANAKNIRIWAVGGSALKHLQNNLDKLDLVPSQRKSARVNRRGPHPFLVRMHPRSRHGCASAGPARDGVAAERKAQS
jgi:hypothetical protein